jgi:2',3'-cyclic-nucleotide 2'-phosphodiesterase (5'-nucleotidase family)
MADSFIRVTLKDGSTHTVIPDGDPAAIVNAAAQGQRWGDERGWIEVEGGGAVTRRLVAAEQVVTIELFER